MVSFALDRISRATAKDIENGSMLIGVKKEASRGQTALKTLQPCGVLISDALAKTLFGLIGILQFAYIIPSPSFNAPTKALKSLLLIDLL